MSHVVRKIIKSPKAPAPNGPYSSGVLVDKTLYVSGTLGVDPKTGKLVSENAAEQAKQALVNVGYILEEAGCSYENVVKCTLLLTDINDFSAINNVYKDFFKSDPPARSTFQVAALPRNGRFEIECIAVIDKDQALKSLL